MSGNDEVSPWLPIKESRVVVMHRRTSVNNPKTMVHGLFTIFTALCHFFFFKYLLKQNGMSC
jgi:hypothetical protein